ncbi:MAG: XRE family transcriptional regulator [Porphyromonadaceae bacterium]|nr:MAG: XRE family transcriptional regulator [Porphyromonadaceae bacterium]
MKAKQDVAGRIRQRIKPENRQFVSKNLAITEQIYSLLKERGWSQKEFAKRLGKHESEVSRWLSGLHNLTLDSIVKMEVALGKEIIITSKEDCHVTPMLV